MQQTILDNLNTAIITLDEQFQVQYLNPAAESMLDISLKRIQGHPVTDLVEQDDLPADLDRVIGNNHQYTRRQTVLRIHDEAITVDYSVTPVRSPEACPCD